MIITFERVGVNSNIKASIQDNVDNEIMRMTVMRVRTQNAIIQTCRNFQIM